MDRSHRVRGMIRLIAIVPLLLLGSFAGGTGGVASAQSVGETLLLPFVDGTAGVQTTQTYSGQVTVSVSGYGQAAGDQQSDAFYIYTDQQGHPVTPWHPTTFYNFTLWINGGPANAYVNPIPPYSSAHIYTFVINAPGGHLTFAVGDAFTADNNGEYTVSIAAGNGSQNTVSGFTQFYQNDPPWGPEEYDYAAHFGNTCDGGSTIITT